ncbi:hypothetical protein RB3490 [Rhodopirellula baltica SH 1]|uniref:Uncharacterized protein n=1 Tax=Rhodopirellula baltica (strain DSM 10527 / NCIMB 13988 / SH1) TaxID=243090 RepID=Q7UU61_RHOBA|nr:hypothetical protein RB3490 [Rhodopirellula baltica SH 1]
MMRQEVRFVLRMARFRPLNTGRPLLGEATKRCGNEGSQSSGKDPPKRLSFCAESLRFYSIRRSW